MIPKPKWEKIFTTGIIYTIQDYSSPATITARGVCWSSTNSTPTISNSISNNGTGIGSFSSSMTGLLPNTTYYVRAYATNSVGTAYEVCQGIKKGPVKGPLGLSPPPGWGAHGNSVQLLVQPTA